MMNNPFDRLRTHGLTENILQRALVEAELRGRDQATMLHPSWFGGSAAVAWCVASMRKLLFAEGWSPLEVVGQSQVVNSDKMISIAAMGGNERTGLPGEPEPRAKNSKGEVTRRSAHDNACQLNLPMMRIERVTPLFPRGAQTWVLLFRREPSEDGAGKIFYEVSLPVDFAAGNITAWHHREIFKPIDLDAPPEPGAGGDDPGDDSTRKVLDIAVRRR